MTKEYFIGYDLGSSSVKVAIVDSITGENILSIHEPKGEMSIISQNADWAEQNPIDLKHSILVETGGMKGRRAPMHREALHQTLRNTFSIDTIYSEYGMTECMGQAWSKDGQGNFEVNAQFQVYIRPINQLYTHAKLEQRGVIQIVDLGNDKSCGVSFLETEDIGEMINDRCFKVHGRADGSEARGCNLMMEE